MLKWPAGTPGLSYCASLGSRPSLYLTMLVDTSRKSGGEQINKIPIARFGLEI
jgi:hypothetical protein